MLEKRRRKKINMDGTRPYDLPIPDMEDLPKYQLPITVKAVDEEEEIGNDASSDDSDKENEPFGVLYTRDGYVSAPKKRWLFRSVLGLPAGVEPEGFIRMDDRGCIGFKFDYDSGLLRLFTTPPGHEEKYEPYLPTISLAEPDWEILLECTGEIAQEAPLDTVFSKATRDGESTNPSPNLIFHSVWESWSPNRQSVTYTVNFENKIFTVGCLENGEYQEFVVDGYYWYVLFSLKAGKFPELFRHARRIQSVSKVKRCLNNSSFLLV